MIIKNKTLFTTHPSSDREKKNLLFLNLIHRQRSISRTEISKLTDITAVTVSNYINGYLKKGLVLERGYEVSSGGRRPELVEINKEWGYVAGLDINENTAKTAIMNMDFDILATISLPFSGKTNIESDINNVLDEAAKSAKIDRSKLKKIGIAEENIKALSLACGEKSLNPELKETSTILYVYSDVGQCVFIKGEEFYEEKDAEGKFSYLRKWGANLSVINEAKRMVEEGIGTKIVDLANGNLENMTLDTVIEAAKQKDETAVDLIKVSGLNLGVRIAYLVNLLEPEIVIIGGGIEKAGDIFLNPLSSSIKKFVSLKMLDKIKVALSILGEESAAKGAASLALREVFIEA